MTKIITRRTLIKSAPAVGIVTLAVPAIVRAAALGSHPPHFTGRNGFVELVAANTTIPSFTVSGGTGGTGFPWPGQPGNLVGYAADPGYTGTLTPHTGGLVNGGTYSQFLFDAGVGTTSVSNSGVTFNGCYFGSSVGNCPTSGVCICARYTGTIGTVAPVSNFCTFAPSPSVIGGTFPPQPPSGGGYATWPSLNSTSGIGELSTYQYGAWTYGGFPVATEVFRSCDMWGFSNGIMIEKTNGPIIVDNCWLHDPADPSPGGEHTDGVGDVQSQGNDFISNLTINHCTISFLGNTEAIAMQMTTTDVCTNWTITNNYLGGESYTIWFGDPVPNTFTGINFSNNVFGHLMMALYGTVQHAELWPTQFSRAGSGNFWRTNTFDGGNYNLNGGSLVNVPAGQYCWPDGLNHATDWTGAF